MAKAPKKPEIKDEPGAEERFDNILKRALSTPPKRKQEAKPKKERPKGK